jgi:hypothetical protein
VLAIRWCCHRAGGSALPRCNRAVGARRRTCGRDRVGDMRVGGMKPALLARRSREAQALAREPHTAVQFGEALAGLSLDRVWTSQDSQPSP